VTVLEYLLKCIVPAAKDLVIALLEEYNEINYAMRDLIVWYSRFFTHEDFNLTGWANL